MYYPFKKIKQPAYSRVSQGNLTSSIFNSPLTSHNLSRSAGEPYPDKVSDQISDALLDQFLAFDANSKVAIETLVTTGQVVVAGEVKSSTYVDVQEVMRGVINKIGYTKAEYRFDGDSCGLLTAILIRSVMKIF